MSDILTLNDVRQSTFSSISYVKENDEIDVLTNGANNLYINPWDNNTLVRIPSEDEDSQRAKIFDLTNFNIFDVEISIDYDPTYFTSKYGNL